MPDLIKSLQGRDLGHLNIVAQLWQVDFSAPDVRTGLQRLGLELLNRERIAVVVAQLPPEARSALGDLMGSEEARLPWALFSRRYGVVREMGPGRRDRDRPHLKPVSPAEALWYRALIGRAFFDTPAGPEEFAYIPDDLVNLLPPAKAQVDNALGRAASPVERAVIQHANDHLLDHVCTLLAALRLGFRPEVLVELEAQWNSPAGKMPSLHRAPPLTIPALKALLVAAGLVDSIDMPLLEPVREFLEAGRGQALAFLARHWLHSALFNELRLLPGVRAEGEWKNDPLRARQSLLDFLATIPAPVSGQAGEFWSLVAFVKAIHQHYPDFQRPAGDYDSWYLWDEAQGEYLRGFEHWERVDGALVRYIIAGPMHWLGMVDLAWSADPMEDVGARLTAFRFSAWAEALLHGQVPAGLAEENAVLQVGSDARLIAPRLLPRAVRYQLARFSEWEAQKGEAYHYRLTPASLARARQQGLTPNHLLRLLPRHAQTVAPSLVRAIERWERLGVEARLEQVTVLRLATPDLLQAVRASKAARFLGDPLGPTSVIVKPGAAGKVLAILAELGYLGQFEQE
jgi:hypothetical protein